MKHGRNRQQIERVLFNDCPFDLRRVGCRISVDPTQSLCKSRQAGVLTPLRVIREIVEKQRRICQSKGIIDQGRPVSGEARSFSETLFDASRTAWKKFFSVSSARQ